MLALTLTLLAAMPAPQTSMQIFQSSPQTSRVYAGIYLADVSGFDLREGRFQADLDVWLKWSGASEPPVLRFVNGEVSNKEEQEHDSDGEWHSIRYRVQGTFRGTFPLQAFPFDRQQLKIQLALPSDSAHLVPDLGSSGMAKQFSITGWEYEPFFRAETGRDVVASDLGSIKGEGKSRVLESVEFIVDLRRPATSNILKFMLPLAVILIMAFLVFALPAGELEVRSAMGVTALLSVVAFHFAMSDALPDVPYLVAADRLFLTSYVLVLLSVLESVIRFRLGEERESIGRRLDRFSAVVLSSAALIVAFGVLRVPAKLDAAAEAARIEALKREVPKPRVSVRTELRVGVPALPAISGNGISALLRRGLTNMNADGELEAHLAESIPAMTDESVRLLPDGGMRVRWRLKPGLKWSDGHPITSDDLIYSLGLINDPDRSEVAQVDDRTIEIRYVRRISDAFTDFPLYPKHLAEQLSRDGGVDALRARNQSAPLPGDGPYRTVSFTANKELVLERNPFFIGPTPAIATVRFVVVPPDQLAAAMQEGKIDFIPVLPLAATHALRTIPFAQVDSALDETLLMLQPDLSVPALADLRIRRALLHALDRAAIARAFTDDAGRVARTYRPSDAADFAEDAINTAYSLDEAKKLFAEAGGAPALKLILTDNPAGTGYAKAQEVIASQLALAGVTLERSVVSPQKANETFQRGTHGGLFLYTRKDKRAARFFNLPVASGGVLDIRTPRTQFPPELVELNRELESSLFPERRNLLSIRLQRAFAEDLPLLPLAFGTQVSGRVKDLEGFRLGQAQSVFWNAETWTLGGGPGPQ